MKYTTNELIHGVAQGIALAFLLYSGYQCKHWRWNWGQEYDPQHDLFIGS